ncbi:MAG: protein-L-isoaspartate(D-aspartate) O-methyltransferase [Planctomycetota bacterium]|nr:MAG: protein-L-isoaspartate(D-aspartate) O-methyltransferase [Planctomycetota bacterium]
MPVTLGLLVLAALFVGSSLLTLAAEKKDAEPNQPKQKQKAAKKKEKKPPRPDHSYPAFTERTKERNRLVSRWIERQGVRDPNVLTAMRTVPRHEFVRPGDSRRAYGDHPISIGLGQTISQPYIVAYMTEALNLRPEHKVLEVGTGSGYQAAVCAEIAQQVYTIEIIEALAKSAKQRLKKLGYPNVSVKAADGYFGWPEHAPFDAIIVTAAAGLVPPPLTEQLKPNGRMILPLGSPYGSQTLVLITKDDKGEVRSKGVMGVRFVPMTGHILESKRPPKK